MVGIGGHELYFPTYKTADADVLTTEPKAQKQMEMDNAREANDTVIFSLVLLNGNVK